MIFQVPIENFGKGTFVIFGEVVGVYIDDEFINEGLFDASKARPLVRLGYMNYGVVGEENTFAKKIDHNLTKMVI